MVRFPAVFSRISTIYLAVAFCAGCVSTASAQDTGARIRLLEEKLIRDSPGNLPVVSYSVRDIGHIAGAARLAMPEAGGHALVLTEVGKVWAWGDNRRGQLGVGDTTVHPGWVAVPELDAVVAIAAGAGHSVALRHDGSVWTWGANEQAQSGDGSFWARYRPERVQGLRDVVAVAAGTRYTLALRRDGTVWTWGSNWTGVAPGVAEKTLLAPVAVRGLEKVAAIWVRGDRPYARDAEGRQWTWGTPETRPRQVEAPQPEQPLRVSWPGLLNRDREVGVVEGALEVEQDGDVAARFELGGALVDLQAGWTVGWIEAVAVTGEVIPQEPVAYVLAAEAPVASSQLRAEVPLALTPSATALGSGPSPSVFGASVSLTATVSPTAASGQVTFYDGTTVLGVGTLAGGTATLATGLLPAGDRSLRAYYWGDAIYADSTSGWITQAVIAQPANGFLAAVSYGAGTDPQSVARGDFNGDGKADLVVANEESNDVSVLLGIGDGTFQPAVNYGAGTEPTAAAVGDFNGDGKADLAVPNVDGVSVLLGNGNGTFQAVVNYGAGARPYSVAMGDFNGDGRADLALANIEGNNVSVLLGNGNGAFQAAVNYGAGTSPFSVAVGDFNGDGKADLAVANYDSSDVSVLLGSGTGTFQAAVNYAARMGPTSLAIADFNADGNADLAVANYPINNVSVLLGNGNGTFRAAVGYGTGSDPYSVAVGDFNGDGKADLAVANLESNNVSLLLGSGNGAFQAALNYGAGVTPKAVTVGDFNGDGRADLAVANPTAGASVLVGIWVPPVSTTATTLGATPNPSVLGQTVTLRATVTPSAATGQVIFYDGTSELGMGTLAGGTATLGTSLLPAGDRTLRAYYVGDSAYLPSASGSVTQTVTGSSASSTALVAAPNPSVLGQLVTLTATVSPSAALGQVTFYDGTTLLAVATLAGGRATFQTSLLPAGSRSLRAQYLGDAVYLPSTSGSVTQTITSTTPGFRYLGSMAQLASGHFWKTSITLVNQGVTAARARLDFFNNSGTPLALPITYPSLPPADPVLLTSVERSIEPGASFSFYTEGPDDVETVGWAQLFTDGDISGFAVFRQKVHREQEAVVPLETRNSDAYVLWFNNSGDFITGVAVANAAAQPASIPVIVRDEAGNQIGTQTLELPTLGHISGALTDIIDNTAGKVGSVEFRTPQGGQISVLGLRFNGVSFTTVPVLDRSLQTPTAPLPTLVPAGSAAQLASGHYWDTTITLVNKGSFAARTKVEFFDNEGNPLVLPVTFPATPGVPAVMTSTVERTLASGASLSFSSTGPVDIETVGWARMSTDGDVGGFAIFRQNVDGAQEALVPMEIANPDAWLLWFDNTGTFASGIAAVNNTITEAHVQMIVRDEAGAQIHTQTLELPGLGHVSGAMTNMIENTGAKVGSVEFRTPPGGAITLLGLRFNGVSFTTIPVMTRAVP